MEIYCYKVVYLNGVCVRVAPSIDSERTGEVIPYGTIFESTKSLILDGVNYVKLADGSGWVFSSKGSTAVLDLIEVIRVQPDPAPSSFSAATTMSPGSGASNSSSSSGMPSAYPPSISSPASSSKRKALSDSDLPSANSDATPSASSASSESAKDLSPTPSDYDDCALRPRKNLSHLLLSPSAPRGRNTQLWREIRQRVRKCATFHDLSQLVSRELAPELLPPIIPEPGPARSAWMAHAAADSDHMLRGKISLVAGVTWQCSDQVSDIAGLESHLWVLAHLGAAEVSHVLRLFDTAAQDKFETLPPQQKDEVLQRVSELGAATRTHNLALARQLDMLPDDLRHLLQRWVIIKIVVRKDPSGSSSGSGDESSNKKTSPKTTLSHVNRAAFAPTPTNIYIPPGSQQTKSEPITTASAVLNFLAGCQWRSTSPTDITQGPQSSPTRVQTNGTSPRKSTAAASTMQCVLQTLGEYQTYARNLATNPDVQLASLL